MNSAGVFEIEIQISIAPALTTPRRRISDSSFANAVRSFHHRAALWILNQIRLESGQNFAAEFANLFGKDLRFNELKPNGIIRASHSQTIPLSSTVVNLWKSRLPPCYSSTT